jgi:serine/threonine-protein kinase PknK
VNAPLLPALPGYDNPQLIAHGTTALVFRAIQTNLNRPVAIKVITVDTGSVPVNAARELATTVALSSQPHIVSIIDTGMTDDDRPYIVMEYCEGGSYAQILRHAGPLPVDDVLEVGIKIGEALHAAHQVGIVHRDVKPSNILRSRFGPALTDFGIARAPDELGSTLTREMMTPHHASPEALLHQAQSGPSDIYSLASTLWTLLVGHPPFVDPAQPMNDMYIFRDRVLHDPLPAMSREDVPAWLVGELGKAMSKLPAQRHGTAFEFAETLRRGALGLTPTPGRPTTAPAGGPSVHTPGVPSQAWPVPGEKPVPPPPPPAPPSPPPPVEVAPVEVGPWYAPPPPRPAPATADSLFPPPPATPPKDEPLTWFEGAPPHLSAPPPRPAAASHALARPDPPRPEPDEGGWLGSVQSRSAQSRRTEEGWDEPEPAVDPFHGTQFVGTRRFGDRDVVPQTGGRRGGLVAVLVGVAVIAVASASLLLLRSGNQPDQSTAPTPNESTTLITGQSPGMPTDVKIAEDRGTSVTLTWTDPTAGTVSFVIVQKGSSGERFETKTTAPATLTVTFTGLDRAKNYCFTVGAVYTVTNVAVAPDICTRR